MRSIGLLFASLNYSFMDLKVMIVTYFMRCQVLKRVGMMKIFVFIFDIWDAQNFKVHIK